MPDDFDALDCARQQLRTALAELDGTTDVPVELRVQLGLLAAQVAVSERLARRLATSAAPPSGSLPVYASLPGPVRVVGSDGEVDEWDVELIEKIFERANASGLTLIRALVAAGGRISTDRLREISGLRSLAPMTRAINQASRDNDRTKFAISLVRQRHNTPDPGSRVVEYYFPPEALPLVVVALDRVDRRRRTANETLSPSPEVTNVVAAVDIPAADPVQMLERDGTMREWTVDLIGQVLSRCTPSAIDMIRAIAEAGGQITTDELLNVTHRKSFAGMTQAVRGACFDDRRDQPHIDLVRRRRAGWASDETARITEMYFAPEVLPLVVAALARWDAAH